MKFDGYAILLNPFFLTFVTLFLGVWFGEWKRMGKMKFGVGGPLFIGIPLGWLCHRVASSIPEGGSGYKAAQSFLSSGAVPSDMRNLVLILFVAAIGLLASRDLKLVLKKYGVQFVVLGVVITIAGAGLSYLSAFVMPGSNVFEASGIYTGALTSSPGLGMAMESSEKQVLAMAGNFDSLNDAQKARFLRLYDPSGTLTSDNAGAIDKDKTDQAVKTATGHVGTGYAVSYPFGMLAVILAMLLIPKLCRIDVQAELEAYRRELARPDGEKEALISVPFELKSFALVCTVGYLAGMVEIYLGPLGYFSLGSIGGVLLVSIGLGSAGKLGPFHFRMDSKVLGAIRDLTLACYIGMIGLSYGYQVVDALVGSGLYLAAASLIIAFLCIAIGYLLGRRVFKLNWILLSGAICGGMTSTPGLGMAIDTLECDDPATGYAATYPSALIGMVLFTNIMYNL